MTTSDFLGKGWKFPISVQDGKIATSEGEDNIKESVMIVLSTAKGERVMRPDFGCEINELTFAVNDTSTATLVAFHVEEALEKWEPRIEVLDVSASPDGEEKNKAEDVLQEFMSGVETSQANFEAFGKAVEEAETALENAEELLAETNS